MRARPPSEFSLIDFIRRQPQAWPDSLLRRIGDDCAVFEAGAFRRWVTSADLLIENVHFRNDWTSPRWLGRKSCAVNVSDLAAMGALPYACLLSLGLPAECTGDYFREFIQGFLEECATYRMSLVGGDLSSSDRVVISVTVFGSVGRGEALYRSGACPGDTILSIGRLGHARAGLEYLRTHSGIDLHAVRSEVELAERVPDPEAIPWLIAHCLPSAQVAPALWLQEHGLAHALIDVSDGLGNDLQHVLTESQVDGEIDPALLPGIPGIESSSQSREFSLNGGEDYALLLTASADQWAELERTYPSEWPAPQVLGRILPGTGHLYLLEEGRRTRYRKKGYDHFA